MSLIGGDDVAAAAAALATEARATAGRLDEHRAALARCALVWWEGGAAQAYQQLVRDRANALARASHHLARLAQACDALAADARLADPVRTGETGAGPP